MTYQLRQPSITLDAALRDLGARTDRDRARAAHALGDVTDPADRARAVPALVGALRDRHPAVRAEAAMSLGDLESEAAVEPLVDRLADGEPQVRQAAAIALGRLGLSAAFDALARALASGPPDLRFQAATSLAEIDPDRAREPLRRALDDGDGEVVAAAALALGAIGEQRAADRLAGLLEVWSRPQTRFDIAYALADLGDARGLDVLIAALADDANAWDAVCALERLGPPVRGGDGGGGQDPRPAALARAIDRRKTAAPVRMRAASALLALIGDDPDSPARAAAQGALLAGLRDRKREHRGLAVQLLGERGGAWAIEPLEALRRRRAGQPLIDEIDAAIVDIRTRAEGAGGAIDARAASTQGGGS